MVVLLPAPIAPNGWLPRIVSVPLEMSLRISSAVPPAWERWPVLCITALSATGSPAWAVSGVTRNSLVGDLNAGTKTRSDVLRLIAEAQEVNSLQFRHAYVAMQYYGYLRRKPEPSGYQAWLDAISPPRSAPPPTPAPRR